MQNFKENIARVEIFFFSLLWLMVLLFVGTVSQGSIGLYASQNLYFSSFIAWFGFVPVPGGYLVMSVIFINLLAKLLFFSPWNIKSAGVLVTHMGALLLLFGGFLTAAFSYEGHMSIPEGEVRGYISDYHDRELVVLDAMGQEGAGEVFSVPYDRLGAGDVLGNGVLPFEITILKHCRNCALMEDRDKNIILRALPHEKEDEINQSGVELRIDGSKGDDGVYIVSEFFPLPNIIRVGDKEYRIILRRARVVLPFEIKLIDFQKKEHPGTSMAKSYSSEVILIDGDMEWRNVISMNEPLRYKGYTLYQSSFISDGGQETTVLAVVKNVGRIFPYIASIVMCIGLLIHLFSRMPKLMRKI